MLSGLVLLVTAGVVLNLGGNVESRINLSQFEATIGHLHREQRQFDEAIERLERALALDPDNGWVYDVLGNTYLDAGRVASAESLYTEALSRYPGYPPYNFGLGRAQELLGRYAQATDSYRRVLDAAKNHVASADRLARVFEAQGQLDSALYYFEWVARHAKRNERLNRKIEELRQQTSAGS